MNDEVKQRKIEHIQMALENDITAKQTAGWQDIHLVHQCLPEVDLDEIDTSVEFLGHTLKLPIFVSSLTGGHPDVVSINRNLARAAQEYGLAMGVGSQRAGIVSPELTATYEIVRKEAPDAFLIANIGAPQLIKQERHEPFTAEDVQKAVDMIHANALAIHMNYLQEAVQPEGDRKSMGCYTALHEVIRSMSVPVIAKETGAGVSREQAAKLHSNGVEAIDVGGAGGSSMAALETHRAEGRGDSLFASIGQVFRDWGIPTPISVVESSTAGLPLIATGGVRSGLDAAKAIALGATLVGVGFPFLKAASQGYDAVQAFLEQFITELKVAMQLTGSSNIVEMQQSDAVITGETRQWLEIRGFHSQMEHMANRHTELYQP